MSLSKELNSLMAKYRFRPSRKMGQNFIKSEAVIYRLIEEGGLKADDVVLEIGAGTGFLTREMQKICKVIAVEKDDSLFRILENELPKENLELIHGDALTAELPEFTKCVSLPPYMHSKEIALMLLEKKIESAILVFQKEFAEKLIAEPGFFEYSALTVLTRYYTEPEIVEIIPAESFYPKPNSDSALVKLNYGKKIGRASDESLFRKFLQETFRYKNKNLSNALEKAGKNLIKGKKEFAEFLEKSSGLELAEEKVMLIEPKEFVKIFNALFR